jgi:hypothetical protein
MADPDWLPKLLRLEDFDGNWDRYLDAVYTVFHRDFIEHQAFFHDAAIRVGSQIIDGMERTFWHLTSEGDIERTRTPSFRRCERIGWVRAIIDHTECPVILSWSQSRGRNKRQLLWLKDHDYLVVLEQRRTVWWLWTAYPTDRVHTRRKLSKEYEAYKKANAAL